MKILGAFVLLAVLFFAGHCCGRSIEKRKWGDAVVDFLFALGAMLLIVRDTPSL